MKAFIARSFAPGDELKLKPLLDFLDSFRKVGFICQTAEPAEVESVSVKVRRMIDEADVFVGIFTRKHPIHQGLKGELQLRLSREARLWGPPTWVVQESGYALRAQKDLILLREQNVEMAGLQGDLEYIPFDPGNLAAVFSRLSQMINSLLAKAAGIHVEVVVSAQSPEAEQTMVVEAAEAREDQRHQPQLAPMEQQYLEMLRAAKARDLAAARVAYAAGLGVIDEGQDQTDRVWWECFYHRTRFRMGDRDALESVRALGEQHPGSPQPPACIAHCLVDYGEFDGASAEFLRAASLSRNDEKLSFLLRAAEALKQAKRYEDARRLALRDILPRATAGIRLDTLALLYELLKLSNEDHEAFALAEYTLRENPGQSGLRFKLGNDYLSKDLDGLAAYHFQMILKNEPQNYGAFHNLALALSNSGLSIMSATNYKTAIELGGTLAAANLAYKYLDCGMVDDSKRLLEAAQKVEGHADRVERCLADVTKRKDEEEQKLNSLFEAAVKQKEFLTEAGDALLAPTVPPIDGGWGFPFGEMDIKVVGDRVGGCGRGEVETSPFSALFAAGLGKPDVAPARRIESYAFTGRLRGRLCSFEVTIEPESKTFPLAFMVGTPKAKGYILFDASGLVGSVCETVDSKLKDPYPIQKLQAAGAAAVG